MREIAIYGAGGLGKEVFNLLTYQNKICPSWNIIGFFDDGSITDSVYYHGKKILGGWEAVNSWKTPLSLVMCIGTPNTLKKVLEKINNGNISFPNIISPDFVIEDEDSFNIGKGNIIKSNCRVTSDVSVGDFNIFNGSITLGHDVHIENFNVFMPGVRISGGTTIGNCNLFGSMSFVKQYLTVGNNITLSPLSPLLSNPKDNGLYIGNPAKLFKF